MMECKHFEHIAYYHNRSMAKSVEVDRLSVKYKEEIQLAVPKEMKCPRISDYTSWNSLILSYQSHNFMVAQDCSPELQSNNNVILKISELTRAVGEQHARLFTALVTLTLGNSE